jgi:hypothetical protein
MKALSLVAMALSIVGCTTVNDLLTQKPEVEYTSKKPVSEIEKCIMNEYSKHTFTVQAFDSENGRVLNSIQNQNGHVDVAILMKPESQSTDVKYFRRPGSIFLDTASPWVKETVIKCK